MPYAYAGPAHRAESHKWYEFLLNLNSIIWGKTWLRWDSACAVELAIMIKTAGFVSGMVDMIMLVKQSWTTNMGLPMFAHVCPQIAILIGKYGKMMIIHWNWDELKIPHDNLNDMAMFGEIHQSPRRARTARAVAGWAQGGFGNVQVKCYLDMHVPGVKPEEKNQKSHADICSNQFDITDAWFLWRPLHCSQHTNCE